MKLEEYEAVYASVEEIESEIDYLMNNGVFSDKFQESLFVLSDGQLTKDEVDRYFADVHSHLYDIFKYGNNMVIDNVYFKASNGISETDTKVGFLDPLETYSSNEPVYRPQNTKYFHLTIYFSDDKDIFSGTRSYNDDMSLFVSLHKAIQHKERPAKLSAQRAKFSKLPKQKVNYV